MAYKRVVASTVSSHSLSEFSSSCMRCGRMLKGKGQRGDANGLILCKDCTSDRTWKALATGKARFDDLTHEDVA